MVAHQAIRQYLKAVFVGVFAEQCEIHVAVFVGDEDHSAPVAALGHVMRESRHHYAHHASHFSEVKIAHQRRLLSTKFGVCPRFWVCRARFLLHLWREWLFSMCIISGTLHVSFREEKL
jgi:hypothetical protein